MSALRVTISQQKFLDSDEAEDLREALKLMVTDKSYNTEVTYSAGSGHTIEFVEKHMKYLSDHPKLNPDHYLSNLRLMTRLNR